MPTIADPQRRGCGQASQTAADGAYYYQTPGLDIASESRETLDQAFTDEAMTLTITDVESIWLRVPALDATCEWGEDAFLVRVHTDAGLVGIGESDSSPAVLKAIIDTPSSHTTARGLREVLIGEDALDIERLWQKMYKQSAYFGRRGAGIHAISALDIALWDIASQFHGVPIHQLLGGKKRDCINAYGTFIPAHDPTANADIVYALRDHGFNRLKLGGAEFGFDPDHDEEVVATVRAAGGGDMQIAIDLVSRWETFDHASEQIRRLSPYGLAWVEEPLPAENEDGLRRLSDTSRVPISGGEGLTTAREFASFLETTRPAIIQPDITRAGGITEMLRIAALAASSNTRLVPHGFSTGILLAATIQFLATQPEGTLVEYSRSTSPLFTDLVTNPILMTDGTVPVSDEAGLGVQLDEALLDRYRVETHWKHSTSRRGLPGRALVDDPHNRPDEDQSFRDEPRPSTAR